MGTKFSVTNAGYIDLSGKVIVSDPCYKRNSNYNAKDITVKPGKYAAYIIKADVQDWGTRVAYLLVVHDSNIKALQSGWVPYDDGMGDGIWVNSGQCGIFDDTIYPQDDVSVGDYDDESTFYGKCCKLTLGDKKGDILKNGKGVVSSSGFGDGEYELLCKYHEGECVALMIDFDLVEKYEVIGELLNS